MGTSRSSGEVAGVGAWKNMQAVKMGEFFFPPIFEVQRFLKNILSCHNLEFPQMEKELNE